MLRRMARHGMNEPDRDWDFGGHLMRWLASALLGVVIVAVTVFVAFFLVFAIRSGATNA